MVHYIRVDLQRVGVAAVTSLGCDDDVTVTWSSSSTASGPPDTTLLTLLLLLPFTAPLKHTDRHTDIQTFRQTNIGLLHQTPQAG